MAILVLVPGCSVEPSNPGSSGSALSFAACEKIGGKVIPDPGDGRTYRDGCPNGRALLGYVELGVEGGICCACR